jgi:hypothetical protein
MDKIYTHHITIYHETKVVFAKRKYFYGYCLFTYKLCNHLVCCILSLTYFFICLFDILSDWYTRSCMDNWLQLFYMDNWLQFFWQVQVWDDTTQLIYIYICVAISNPETMEPIFFRGKKLPTQCSRRNSPLLYSVRSWLKNIKTFATQNWIKGI